MNRSAGVRPRASATQHGLGVGLSGSADASAGAAAKRASTPAAGLLAAAGLTLGGRAAAGADRAPGALAGIMGLDLGVRGFGAAGAGDFGALGGDFGGRGGDFGVRGDCGAYALGENGDFGDMGAKHLLCARCAGGSGRGAAQSRRPGVSRAPRRRRSSKT